MPTYEYQCNACGHEFERVQRITDAKVKTCPKCKKRKVERLISQTSFVLKGGGWYNDLYASKKDGAGKDAAGKDAAADAGAPAKGDSAGDSKSESGGDAGAPDKGSDDKGSKDKGSKGKGGKSKGSKAAA
jgi:putative FmdB family regulatory protein